VLRGATSGAFHHLSSSKQPPNRILDRFRTTSRSSSHDSHGVEVRAFTKPSIAHVAGTGSAQTILYDAASAVARVIVLR
jgi:hypothetical protein